MIVQNIFKDAERVPMGIPAYYTGSKEISSSYICAMIDSGMYAITYPQAIDLFGGRNIIQIHRDLPGACTSSYRILLTKKLGNVQKDPEFLHEQMEFYVPLPNLLNRAKDHFLEYILNADENKICYDEPNTAGVKYRKITLSEKPANKLEAALLSKVKAREFYIIIEK